MHLIQHTRQLLHIKHLRLTIGRCPFCGLTLVLRLNDNELSIRCLICRSSTITMSLGHILLNRCPELKDKVFYELSCRGPLYNYLKRHTHTLYCSEYFDDIVPGEYQGPIQCQDVQALTYASRSFDICTSTEVFEHVPDDMRGFREIHRVLKDDGQFIFTVPIKIGGKTVERVRRVDNDNTMEHILPPVYHGDRLRGDNQVLCYRDYGEDICSRLLTAGFSSARLITPESSWFGYNRPVVLALKTKA